MYPRSEYLPASAIAFLKQLEANDKQPGTIRRYAYDLADFYHFLDSASYKEAENSPKLLDGRETEHFFTHIKNVRSYELRTLKRIHTVLNQYFLFLKTRNELSTDPLQEIALDESVWNTIKESDLLTDRETKRLFDSIKDDAGLNERQQAVRPLLAPRNQIILRLFRYYGFSLQEVSTLQRQDVNLGQKTVHLHRTQTPERTIQLSKTHNAELNDYLTRIPEPVRPRPDREDPLFVAFDFQRQTYRWSYENDMPKQLSEVAIQKMIRQEMKRATIRKGLTAKHLRHTYIVEALLKGEDPEQVKDNVGMTSMLAMERYFTYLEEH
ncbi:tyrosine-type recombinase/integrase [Salsuginibacillus kocurii]|uniref:tyrosine-type recombinase/integrase n=1 Tax=Salsuginibacillus kocurii TaxID=427078 RepID=UPI00037C30AA|nr:site-specific integrase [Salsuginibacillus kocurii]